MSDNSTTSTNSPSTQGMIRNINQTVQEREIIKTAPDLIIYLDGKTYLLNPYLTNTKLNQPYTFVSFNDYVQNFSCSVDVDQLVPAANFTLQVPNMAKYLFQAPGGNNLINSMMEVQVFAKGYFASGDGNTVYHRVFKGVVAHVGHTDNGMFLEISVQCLGILHLLEYMHVDLQPAYLSNSARPKVPMTSNQANMNPYQMLADTFLRGVTFEGFARSAIQQDDIRTGYWGDAVEDGYCNKWQPILENLRKEVHILGYRMGEVLPADINGLTQKSTDYHGSMEPAVRAADSYNNTIAQNVVNADFYVNIIRSYLPDFNAAAIQPVNGRIVSRLERIRTIVQLIGYEGFQDLDGTIIFKPPLYNLDVTNIGDSTTPNTQNGTGVPNSTVDITEATNPFVVHLSEIESESETEDEQAIKATRMTIQPDWMANNKFIPSTDGLTRPAITHIDIPKLAKFGLREEPVRTLGWLGLQDKVAAYTYAVSEMNRGNRGWRTYNLTIPLRPELKVGFPMYLPHKDMYGYIKNISISYSQSGQATMSIMLDTLRKRPVFPQTATTGPNQTVYTNPPVVYTTQPNLVMQWTEIQNSTSNTNTSASGVTQPSTLQDWANSQSNTPLPSGTFNPSVSSYGLPSANSPANLLNSPATQPVPPDKPIYAEEMEVVSARRTQYGTSWETKADTRTKNFRVQNDKATADDASNLNGNGQNIKAGDPFFSATNWYSSVPSTPVSATPEFTVDTANQAVVTGQAASNTVGTSTTAVGQGFGTNAITSAAATASASTGNKGINMTYLQKILSCQPFTDEGGYELVTPFPWGRWKNLKEAIAETHLGVLVQNATSQDVEQITGTNVFLFAGVGTVGSTDPSSSLQTELDTLSNVSNQAQSATTFELVTPKPGDQQPNILNNQQPDSSLLLSQVQINTQGATDMFLAGNLPPQPGSALALATNMVDDSGGTNSENTGANTTTTATIENNADVVGSSATQTVSQSQQFINKLNSSNTSTE